MTFRKAFLGLVGVAVLASAAGANTIRFDFETGDLQGWQVVEGRFGALISSRSMSRNTPGTPYPKEGHYYLSTTELADGGFDDDMQGVVESPVVRLTGSSIRLRVGGGAHAETYVALCTEDGTELRHARGTNSEVMQAVVWHVPELVGRRVFLAVVDGRKGSWGHVTLDAVEIEGVVDPEATRRLRDSYALRKEARMRAEQAHEQARAEARARHRRQLQDPRYLFARGKPREYAGASLEAISMPVGGIGTGCLQMDGYARPAIWQVFGNFRGVSISDSILAVRVRVGSGRPVVRALQGRSTGLFQGMQTVRFRGEYPFGWWTFRDPAMPVEVVLEAFSPLVPGNARDSAIPCAIFRVTITNRSAKPVWVHLLALQQNAVGINPETPPDGIRSPAYGGNVNRIVTGPGLTMVSMSKTDHAGTMVVAGTGANVRGAADCGSLKDAYERFLSSGSPGGGDMASSPAGQTVNAALTAGLRLRAGESRTQVFLLAWHFPGVPHGGDIEGWRTEGNMYENWWPDAQAVASEVKNRLPELLRLTRLYHDTLYASNLPYWLLDRISSQVAVLRSMTCFWGKDGYFGAWEGCNAEAGCCAGNCSHVWHYAQAHARLWPEIGRRMREQELRCITPEGAVPHRQPNQPPAFDGQCGTILGAYREYLCSRDGAWLERHWPAIQSAMDYVIRRWDADEDGMLTGPQWNTLDENSGGTSSWLGSLYIAALRACERMAASRGDAASAQRYARIANAASDRQDAALFNGEYFIQLPDPTPYRDYGTGCHIDQVLGQWWADMLGLGNVYREEHVRSALAALHRYNFVYDFVGVPQAPRKFVHDDDAGTRMITWPRGGRPAPEHQMLYADEVMTGFEYAAAAAMIGHGLLEEGFRTARAIADRYDGRLRTGLSGGNYTSWGYSGNPFGDDECGKFYGRSMSSWALLLAAQGFVYDGPAGVIGFRPRWRPEDHVSFFTAAEAWGLFSQKRNARVLKATLAVKHGILTLRTFVLERAGTSRGAQAHVHVGPRPVPCRTVLSGREVRMEFSRPLRLRAGTALEAVVE